VFDNGLVMLSPLDEDRQCLASICFAGCDSLNLPVDNALISATVQISLVRFPCLADDLIECAQSDGWYFLRSTDENEKSVLLCDECVEKRLGQNKETGEVESF